GELVCSNSLRSNLITAPAGLLKEEMRRLDSLILRVAEANRVPAGSALAVDRQLFSQRVTEAGERVPAVRIILQEVDDISEDITILATGPLTSAALSARLASLLGDDHLYFYDAISPIVTAESIDMSVAYRASRYGRDGDDYLNLPMTAEVYNHFVE